MTRRASALRTPTGCACSSSSARVVQDIIPRYRKLADSGRVELSTTPHYHPIGPLLLDFGCAREAMPDAPLPAADHYSGGRSRAHLAPRPARSTAIAAASRPMPLGVWPAEGALSTPFLKLLAEHKVALDRKRRGACSPTRCSKSGPALPTSANAFLYRPYRVRRRRPSPALLLSRRPAVRPDRLRIQGLARQGRGRAFHRAARRHPAPGAEPTSRRS